MADGRTVLGIETSCDETGVAIVRDGRLLADVVASSVSQHAVFGGVVPEIASRAHTEWLPRCTRQALAEADLGIAGIDAIAVAAGPGLMGALLAGASFARGLAVGRGIPLYAVNHLAAHVAVAEIDVGRLPSPAVALLASGGHTDLLLVRDPVGDIVPLGATLDDAAGEAFDKVARVLGLQYPGGPSIDRAARTGDPSAIAFPRGLTGPAESNRYRFDFSFSGLKTAVARRVDRYVSEDAPVPVADIAAAFQEAVVDVLATKTLDACVDSGARHVVLAGGVAANARLRHVMGERARSMSIDVLSPPPRRCTDNGAMIAWLGWRLLESGANPTGVTFTSRSQMSAADILI